MLCVGVVVAVLLIPAITSAFRIDDPLFIWAARQIQKNPLNPYGFKVNWYGELAPMSEVTKNPPGASYYIAGVAAMFGWGEVALHAAFMLVAVAVAIGMFLIARRFCRRPLLATLIGVFTPVFLVSAVTVMSDMLMLCFWVFALHFWLTGLESRKHLPFAASSLLIAASALTKYFGATLIPLLLLHSIVKTRRAGWWILYLLVPAAVLGWYQWVTLNLYGRGLLFDAAVYAAESQSQFGRISLTKACVAFAFTGGCVASALFFSRRLWSTRALVIGGACAGILAAVFGSAAKLGAFPLPEGNAHLWIAIQLGIWITVGASLVALAALDLYRRRDADALLLFSWLIGTLVFSGFVNWTTNGRTILPLIVPAGILIARRLEIRAADALRKPASVTLWPLVASAILAFSVMWVDSTTADASRIAAGIIQGKYGNRPRPTVFQGHWGFQHYMEAAGGRPLNVKDLQLVPGDIVVIPSINANTATMPPEIVRLRETVDVPASSGLATMNPYVGAGFYADAFGPLPFAFGAVEQHQFFVFDVGLFLPK